VVQAKPEKKGKTAGAGLERQGAEVHKEETTGALPNPALSQGWMMNRGKETGGSGGGISQRGKVISRGQHSAWLVG